MKRWLVLWAGLFLCGCVNSTELQKYIWPATEVAQPLAWDCSGRANLPVHGTVIDCARCRNRTAEPQVVHVRQEPMLINPESSFYLCGSSVVIEGVQLSETAAR